MKMNLNLDFLLGNKNKAFVIRTKIAVIFRFIFISEQFHF